MNDDIRLTLEARQHWRGAAKVISSFVILNRLLHTKPEATTNIIVNNIVEYMYATTATVSYPDSSQGLP